MITPILIGVGGVAVGAVVAFVIQSAMKQSAVKVAEKVKNEAQREAEHIQREAKVTARAEILKMREKPNRNSKNAAVNRPDRKNALPSAKNRWINALPVSKNSRKIWISNPKRSRFCANA